MEFRDYLILGSYAFGVMIFGTLWRELRSIKDTLSDIRLVMSRQLGILEGQQHEERINSLEKRRPRG